MANPFIGFDVVVARKIPRYTLPEEVLPGVPWPDGFREDINAWSRSFLGGTELLPPGQAWVIADRTVVVSEAAYAQLRQHMLTVKGRGEDYWNQYDLPFTTRRR